MSRWHNDSGRPLSALTWLIAHHQAKLPERRRFAYSILQNKPKRIVDLGCGPGLWLDVLNEFAPSDCQFVGLDSDPASIEEAQSRSKSWLRPTEFKVCDIASEPEKIPTSDLFLAFNIFSYLHSPESFLEELRERLRPSGTVIVRQYDGAAIRFGPMSHQLRLTVDSSLHASISGSDEFHHYDLDRVYQILENSKFERKNIEFELFQRTSPYPKEFIKYYSNTIEWTLDYVSEATAEYLKKWYSEHVIQKDALPSYFAEVDLTARLS